MSANKKKNQESAEEKESQEGQRAETVAGPSVEDLIKVSQETPQYIAEILEKFGREENVDEISGLNKLLKMVQGELRNAKGETEEVLNKFRADIEAVLDEKENDSISAVDAENIFKEALVKAFTRKLDKKNNITTSGGAEGYTLVFNKEMPNGYFVLRPKNTVMTLVLEPGDNPQIGHTDKSGKFLYEGKEEGTGKDFWTRIVSESGGSKESVTDEGVPLDTKDVRKIFNKLKPAVKKSFLDGLRGGLNESISLVEKLGNSNYREKLKITNEEAEKMKIEEKSQQEEISKQLKALD